ncbi:hypothetical protein COV19_00970 [Candidatus Woesearchaeota archaeon CG10_big_fil_rev_8_21_14_0_10_44_13]|nr:MAG: hypothetical protein COV19_00970 [Candidatus Woesearchaeota archaeon CG10_big_fil_rev_8_21_14_0_10_44_13]
MADWEALFRKKGKIFNRPQEDMPKVIKLLKKEKAKRVLDLGCGTGRHTVMLAKAGFDVYAIDVSDEGLRQTREWLKQKGLKANLKKASCYKRFPFEDDFFDAVISTQVIHHNYIKKVRYCISEIERVLRPGGIVFITVTTSKYGKVRKRTRLKNLAPRTYVNLGEWERGIPHYIYNMKLLRKDFRNFRILKLTKNSHYCLLGKLKK